MELKGRVIYPGRVEGEALKSDSPVSFFGCIDPETGIVTEEGHELQGNSVKDRILVFPHGKGSTVGSYSLYRLKKNNCAPAGIINQECEPIVAVGAIISDIPCIDRIDISRIRDGDRVVMDKDRIIVEHERD